MCNNICYLKISTLFYSDSTSDHFDDEDADEFLWKAKLLCIMLWIDLYYYLTIIITLWLDYKMRLYYYVARFSQGQDN